MYWVHSDEELLFYHLLQSELSRFFYISNIGSKLNTFIELLAIIYNKIIRFRKNKGLWMTEN